MIDWTKNHGKIVHENILKELDKRLDNLEKRIKELERK